MMTAHSTIDNAVAAMKLGEYHYINKPFNLDEVVGSGPLAVHSSSMARNRLGEGSIRPVGLNHRRRSESNWVMLAVMNSSASS